MNPYEDMNQALGCCAGILIAIGVGIGYLLHRVFGG